MGKKRNPRAFTLLEMLVVLAVLGVVASMALPDLTPVVRRTEMRGSTADSVAIVERARREARSSGRCTRVRLDAGSLVLERSAGARCDGAFSAEQRLRAANGVSFALDSSAAAEIAFTPNGRLRGDGDTDVEDDGARIVINSTAFPNQHAIVGVTPVGLVCTRLMSVVPPFDGARTCAESGNFFGASETEDGEIEPGDSSALPPPPGGPLIVVNTPELFVGDDGDDGDGDDGEVAELEGAEMPPPEFDMEAPPPPPPEAAPPPEEAPAEEASTEEAPAEKSEEAPEDSGGTEDIGSKPLPGADSGKSIVENSEGTGSEA